MNTLNKMVSELFQAYPMRFIGPIVSSIVELLSDYPQISNSTFEMFISQRELVC